MQRLVVWFLLPGLLVAAAAGLLLARKAAGDAERTTSLAREAQRSAVFSQALTALSIEIEDLVALQSFRGVPADLGDLVDDALIPDLAADRPSTISELFDLEVSMGLMLNAIQTLERVPAEVGRVMSRLDEGSRYRIRAGNRGFVDPGDYVMALGWVTERSGDADDRSARALATLIEENTTSPYWQSTEFLLAMVVLAVIALSGGLLGAWRAATSNRRLVELHATAEARVADATAHADRLQMLISLGRRLSTDAESQEVAETIADEAAAVLSPDFVVVVLVRDGQLVPVTSMGGVTTGVVAMREGVIGRAAETGMPVRAVASSDPLLPELTETVSLLAVPMVYDARVAGVLVVGRHGGELYSHDDEAVLGLVGMMSAGALRVAERYGSTLALALDDPLTGLGNRRRLDRDLSEIGPHHGDPVSFLMIDIDHFKQFNDEFGHPSGDELLRSVASTISDSVRLGDIAYRFGGEEFSVLLPKTSASTALAVAERVRAAVSQLEPPGGGHSVTVSIGVSQGLSATMPLQMIEAADRALYDAKRAGRDRVTMAAAMTSPFEPPAV